MSKSGVPPNCRFEDEPRKKKRRASLNEPRRLVHTNCEDALHKLHEFVFGFVHDLGGNFRLTPLFH